MLNIVIPMAGAGSRFARAGYADPKPLIPVHGVPMVQLVIDNLRPRCPHRFIFLCQRAHAQAYGLPQQLRRWAPGCEVVLLDGLTQGAACTVLLAAGLIDDPHPLMIANADQYCDVDIDAYLARLEREDLDGLIMTMKAHDPKWSFVRFDAAGRVAGVVEKQAVSDEATVGIYNFRRGADFVRAARAMVARDERVNGEFYVAPVYNDLLREGQRVGVHNIGAEARGMYGLGIPADLDLFLDLPLSRQAVARTEAACA